MRTEYILLTTAGLALTAGYFVFTSENEKIKKLLGKSKTETQPIKVSPVKTNTNSTSYSSSNGITPRSPKSEIIRLQNALIAAGHLAPTQRTKTGKTISSADGIWGNDTNTALLKAGLNPPVTPNQLNAIQKSGSSSSSVSESHTDIAAYIAKEMRSFSTNYEGILSKLKDKTSTEIKSIDTAYRQYSANGLKKDFQTTDKGGKVSWDTINSKAIREILNDAGLSGLGELGEVRTKHPCTVIDEKKGHVVVGKNLVLGTVLQSNARKTLIQTIDGRQLIANTEDLVYHN